MAHRGICPDMACERIAVEVERQRSERKACQVVAEELGVPFKTVLAWAYRGESDCKCSQNCWAELG